MRRLQLSVYICVLSATLSAASVSPRAAELGSPNARVLVGIDLKSLRGSSAGRALSAQVRSQIPPGASTAFLPMIERAIEDIDSIFITSDGVPATGSPNSKAGASQPPFLCVLEGRFENSPLGLLMMGTAERYSDVDLFGSNASSTPTKAAMLNPSTMILGDTASVHAAIDRRGWGRGVSPGLLTRANQLAMHFDIWVLADDLLNSIPASAGAPGLLSSGQIRGLDMGLALRSGMEVEIGMQTKTEEQAMQLASLFSGPLLAAMLPPTATPQGVQAMEMLRRLQVSSEGTRMRVSLSLTAEELDDQIRRAIERRLASVSTPQSNEGSRPKPTPGKIRILGLDEGVREIELTR